MPLILGTNSIKDTGYDVDNSCRFDDGSNCQMRRAGVDGGDQDKFTLSMWIKRGAISTSFPRLFTSRASSNDRFEIYFGSDDTLYVEGVDNGTATLLLNTNREFRDVSAWYHFLLAVDTDQATASNRAKLWINGVQETSFATETYPAQDGNIGINTSSFPIRIAEEDASGVDFDGYLTEIVFLDGVQKTNTDFGEFDQDSGIWKPIDVSDLSSEKGNNGFYLDFEDSSNLGNDVFGGTDFSVSNLSSVDQSTDTCTNNFAVLNPLAIMNNINQNHGDLSEGNLKIVGNSTTNNANAYSTIGFTKGKWYMETKILGTSTHYPNLGIVPYRTSVILVGSGQVGADTVSFAYKTTGQKTNNTDSSYGDSFTTNDIIGIAVDMDNGAIYFSKNGTFQASGDPTSGATKTNPAFSFTPLDEEEYFFAFAVYKTDSGIECNFGSASYSISSGNSDAEGFGNFEYPVPSGYFALCTKNLAEYG